MSNPDIEILTKKIKSTRWLELSEKAKPYIGQFFDQTQIGTKITGHVEGNHGIYLVSIQISPKQDLISACSCYIGKAGYCHHCIALAQTFLNKPEGFIEKVAKKLDDLTYLNDVYQYLQCTTLESLLAQLKARGISQKDFAESIGMSSRHLSSVKSSELANRFHHELGATKLACLWILDRFGKR